MTMKLISTVTVGAGGAASIEFTGIPQTGTDLVLVMSGRNNGSTSGLVNIKFNNNTENRSGRYLEGTGSAASSSTAAGFSGNVPISTDTANTFGSFNLYIPNYAGSAQKSYSVESVTENNATAAKQWIYAGLWADTSAINQVTLTGTSLTLFSQYTTASLYTITKGSGGATAS